MSSLFGSKQSVPQPAPVPAAPTDTTPAPAPSTAEQDQARQDAVNAQTVQYAAAGRRATIVAGNSISDSQKDGIFNPAKKRASVSELLG